jgi:hypothetical protein
MFDELPGTVVLPLLMLLLGARDTRRFFAGVEEEDVEWLLVY